MGDIALHPFGHVPLSTLGPNKSIIKELEDVLQRARDGQIQALAMCFVDKTGVPDTYSTWAGATYHSLLSGMTLIKAKMVAEHLAQIP